MNENQSVNPGEPLKNSREKLGLSISDVSVATKINPRILKALEEGNREGLPPTSFARGFIRSYAAYLKIDSQPILDAYAFDEKKAVPENSSTTTDAATEESAAATSQLANLTTKSDSGIASASPVLKREPTKWPVTMVVSALLVVVFVSVSVKKIYDKYEKERIVEPIDVTTKSLPITEEPAAAVAGAVDGTAEITANALPTLTENVTANGQPKPDAATAAPEVAKPGVDAKPEAAEAKPAPVAEAKPPAPVAEVKPPAPVVAAPKVEAKPAPAVETKPAAETKPAPAETPAVEENLQEVILEALDKVTVTAVIDGNKTEKIELKPEALHTLKGKKSISLDIKDGGMVNIIHNGRDKGVPGDLGKPIKVKYP